MLSLRVSIHFTGRPRRRAANAASTSSSKRPNLTPKPPPTSGAITRIACSDMLRVSASSDLVLWAPWVDVQKVSAPACQCAIQPRGGQPLVDEAAADDTMGARERGV